MRIVVTGGAGFIGSAVCRFLIGQTDHEVCNVDKLTYAGNLKSLREVAGNPRYRFVQADICDRDAIERVFADFVPHAVIHLAAETHVDRSIEASYAFIDTNVVGTLNLLEASRRHLARPNGVGPDAFRFVHVSTDEVYGSLGPEGRFVETTAYSPNSPYAASKASADHLVCAWHATYGVPTIVSNCSNNYGPYHFPEKLIPLAILNGIEGKPIPIYGDGLNIRDWLHVEDHARALYCILTRGKPGEKYNVGANERTHQHRRGHRDLRQPRPAAARRCAAPAPHHARAGPARPRPALRDRCAKAATTNCNGRAEVGFEDGLDATVQWYIANEWWWRPLRRRYSGERLGLIDCQAN